MADSSTSSLEQVLSKEYIRVSSMEFKEYVKAIRDRLRHKYAGRDTFGETREGSSPTDLYLWARTHQELLEAFYAAETPELRLKAGRRSVPTRAPYHRLQSEAAKIRQANQLTVESEGLKTQVISLQRELNTTRRNEEYLQAQNEKQLEYIGELVKALCDVQGALIASNAGRLCMHVTHSGVVTEMVGDEVAVVFQTEDGELEQVYHRSQFVNQRLPESGDKLEAHVLVSRSAETSPAVKPQDGENEFSAFRTKRVTGPVEI
jgi:hypothetical protein